MIRSGARGRGTVAGKASAGLVNMTLKWAFWLQSTPRRASQVRNSNWRSAE